MNVIFNKNLVPNMKLFSENLLQNRNEIKKKLRKEYFSPQNKIKILAKVYANTLKRTSKATTPFKLRFSNTHNTHNTFNTYNTCTISPFSRNNRGGLRGHT